MGWFCCTDDGHAVKTLETAGEVELFVEDMLDEGYELQNVYIFNEKDRRTLKPVTKPSFEFRP